MVNGQRNTSCGKENSKPLDADFADAFLGLGACGHRGDIGGYINSKDSV
jgi:hypothetical protein